MPVIIFSRVDLPLPDLPTMATNSPRRRVRSMPLRTGNSPAAFLKVLTTFCSWMAASAAGAGPWTCIIVSPLHGQAEDAFLPAERRDYVSWQVEARPKDAAPSPAKHPG